MPGPMGGLLRYILLVLTLQHYACSNSGDTHAEFRARATTVI